MTARKLDEEAAIALMSQSHCQTEMAQSLLMYQYLHIKITAPDGILSPADLKAMVLPSEMVWSQGVVIEGRAPLWVYGTLVHACHPAKWIACFDPRLGAGERHTGGAVVVMSHTPGIAVGDVLQVDVPSDYLE